MRLSLIGTAAAALALAAPAVAHADKTVQAGGPDGCTAEGQCSSIQHAVNASGGNETIFITPGEWAGASITKDDLRLVGQGNGQARITSTLGYDAHGTLTLRRLVVRPSSGSAVTIGSSVLSKALVVESSILSGSGSSAAIAATGGLSQSSISITGRHVTIADAGGAPATSVAPSSGPVTATFRHSILKGGTPGFAPDATNDNSGSYDNLFVDRASEDFRLRAGSVAIDQGAGRESSEIDVDIDGESRGTPWDLGADEFVNRVPTQPAIVNFTSSARTGEAAGFGADGATDPDASFHDAVVAYEWDFGDGTISTRPGGNPHFTEHAYAAAGTYQVRARAKDVSGAAGPWSAPVSVTVTAPPPAATGPGSGNTPVGPGGVGLPGIDPARAAAGPDTQPPFLAFASPRAGQRIRVRRFAPMLRGRTADTSGVRRVELALMRRDGARCRWYDGRRFVLGRCTAARWFKAVLDDFDWRYKFPRNVRPRPGAYSAFVRATDYVGNRSTTFDRQTAIAFRYAR